MCLIIGTNYIICEDHNNFLNLIKITYYIYTVAIINKTKTKKKLYFTIFQIDFKTCFFKMIIRV